MPCIHSVKHELSQIATYFLYLLDTCLHYLRWCVKVAMIHVVWVGFGWVRNIWRQFIPPPTVSFSIFFLFLSVSSISAANPRAPRLSFSISLMLISPHFLSWRHLYSPQVPSWRCPPSIHRGSKAAWAGVGGCRWWRHGVTSETEEGRGADCAPERGWWPRSRAMETTPHRGPGASLCVFPCSPRRRGFHCYIREGLSSQPATAWQVCSSLPVDDWFFCWKNHNHVSIHDGCRSKNTWMLNLSVCMWTKIDSSIYWFRVRQE